MKLYKRGGLPTDLFIGALADSGRLYYIDRGWIQRNYYEAWDKYHLFCIEPVSKSELALTLYPVHKEDGRIYIPRRGHQHLKKWDTVPDLTEFMHDPAAFLAMEMVL